MGRRRRCAAALLLVTALHGVGATCPTFVAWLSSSKHQLQGHPVHGDAYEGGFVALTVAPDRKSVVINWQLTGKSSSTQMTAAGIFGPATKEQVKPPSQGMLLDLGTLCPSGGACPAPGETRVRRIKVQSDRMEEVLTWMREEKTYVNVMTNNNPHGEVRGQLVVPRCLDGELSGAQNYGFVNVMLSPDSSDKSVAVLVQMAPDTTGVKAELKVSTGQCPSSGATCVAVDVRNELKADAAVDQGLQHDIMFNGTWVNPPPNSEPCQGQSMTWAALQDVARGAHQDHVVCVDATNNAGLVVAKGVVSKAAPCRLLSTVEDTLFSTAKAFGSDWLTVWSLNDQSQNPDQRRTLTARYYAHPFEVTDGETAQQIMRRFGISHAELVRSNPSVVDIESLSVGDTLCVIPNFRETVSGNGAKICVM